MTRLKILILGVHLFPLCVAPFALAENKFLVEMRAISGQPHIVFSRGKKVSFRGRRSMLPGDHIVTSASSRALIDFRQRPGCRLVLEPNSSFELIGRKRGGTYSAKLNRGFVKCAQDSCGLSLRVMTPAGELFGQGVEFALKAYDRFTTVFLKKGRMRLLVGGQAVPLREMTRTTVSKTGGHRIATMYRGDPRIHSLFSPIPLSGISPTSTKRRFRDKYISPASITRRP
ncbi:MAG: hypothetical protein OXL41_14490 [Nitrospinae bacterium]|nr:hypothetical protein [Nitrospinota bacterium]